MSWALWRWSSSASYRRSTPKPPGAPRPALSSPVTGLGHVESIIRQYRPLSLSCEPAGCCMSWVRGGGSFPPAQQTLPQPPSAPRQLSGCPQIGLRCMFIRHFVFSRQLALNGSSMKHRELKASDGQMQVVLAHGLVAACALGSPSWAALSRDHCIAHGALSRL